MTTEREDMPPEFLELLGAVMANKDRLKELDEPQRLQHVAGLLGALGVELDLNSEELKDSLADLRADPTALIDALGEDNPELSAILQRALETEHSREG